MADGAWRRGTLRSLRLVALLLAALAAAALAWPQASATAAAGNGVLGVLMEEAGGSYPVGSWSSMTLESFGTPAQSGASITFDAAGTECWLPCGANDLAIRSYGTDTVYAQDLDKLPGETFTVSPLSSPGHSPAVTSTASGVRAQWTVTAPDRLDVTQELLVGSLDAPATADNSYVELRIRVCNQGAAGVALGIRSHWDLMVAGNDLNRKRWVSSLDPPLEEGPFSDIIDDTADFTARHAFAFTDWPGQTFGMYGLLRDPDASPLPDPVVTPDRLVFTRWQDADRPWGIDMGNAGLGVGALDPIDPDSSAVFFWGGPAGHLVPAGSCWQVQTYILHSLASLHDGPAAPPVAAFVHGLLPPSPTVGFLDQSTDPDHDIVARHWSFGDGTEGFGASPLHTYPGRGTYTVVLRVTDATGLWDEASQDVTVPNQPPVIHGAGHYMLPIGEPAGIALGATDPDGDPVAFTVGALPDGASYDPAGKALHWTPGGDEVGETYAIPLHAEDGYDAVEALLVLRPFERTSFLDHDADGVPDRADNCPSLPNHTQADSDEDGVGDACTPRPPSRSPTPRPLPDLDHDKDGVQDEADNCPATANGDQADFDDDWLGDACDPDVDGDRALDAEDNCVPLLNPDQVDADGDGMGDACDAVVAGLGGPGPCRDCRPAAPIPLPPVPAAASSQALRWALASGAGLATAAAVAGLLLLAFGRRRGGRDPPGRP